MRKERVVMVKMSSEQKRRLQRGARRDGLDLSPWLLRLAVRDADGRGEETWAQIETVRPTEKWVSGEARTLYINVRMTDGQKEKVERRAEYLGQGLSSWILLLGLLEAGRA